MIREEAGSTPLFFTNVSTILKHFPIINPEEKFNAEDLYAQKQKINKDVANDEYSNIQDKLDKSNNAFGKILFLFFIFIRCEFSLYIISILILYQLLSCTTFQLVDDTNKAGNDPNKNVISNSNQPLLITAADLLQTPRRVKWANKMDDERMKKDDKNSVKRRGGMWNIGPKWAMFASAKNINSSEVKTCEI